MDKANIHKINKAEGAVYAKTIAEKRLGRHATNVVYMGGGSFGMAYKVELDGKPEKVVVKLFKADGMCEEEAAGLRMLKENTSMRVPAVYFTHLADTEVPADCLCMEFIEGVNALRLTFILYSKQKKRAFADAVVDGMLEYHTCTNEKFGPLGNAIYDTWLGYYRPFAEEVLDTARKLKKEKNLDGYIVDAMEAAYLRFDRIFEEPVVRPALIHGDLNVMNVMVEPHSFVPVAFIDPLNAMFGDREFDLFQFNNLTGKCYGLYELYKSKYPISKNCDIKSAFYGLWNEVHVFIKTGMMVKFIMNPLVKNMKKQLLAFFPDNQ